MENALRLAQFSGKHSKARFWKGEEPGAVGRAEDYDGDTYRAVYTVRFKEVVYVLHAFHKSSPKGVRTAQTDIDLIGRRLKLAQQDCES